MVGSGAGAGSDVFDVEHLFLKWWVEISVLIVMVAWWWGYARRSGAGGRDSVAM